jgi:hypothetical protein
VEISKDEIDVKTSFFSPFVFMISHKNDSYYFLLTEYYLIKAIFSMDTQVFLKKLQEEIKDTSRK